jgi:hypothetical protein
MIRKPHNESQGPQRTVKPAVMMMMMMMMMQKNVNTFLNAASYQTAGVLLSYLRDLD